MEVEPQKWPDLEYNDDKLKQEEKKDQSMLVLTENLSTKNWTTLLYVVIY